MKVKKENKPKKCQNAFDDCSCIICRALYKDDKSAGDCIQGIIGHERAPIKYIKTNSVELGLKPIKID